MIDWSDSFHHETRCADWREVQGLSLRRRRGAHGRNERNSAVPAAGLECGVLQIRRGRMPGVFGVGCIGVFACWLLVTVIWRFVQLGRATDFPAICCQSPDPLRSNGAPTAIYMIIKRTGRVSMWRVCVGSYKSFFSKKKNSNQTIRPLETLGFLWLRPRPHCNFVVCVWERLVRPSRGRSNGKSTTLKKKKRKKKSARHIVLGSS